MATVYADILLLVNLIMDAMIHTAACLLRRKRIRIWRLLCASAVEAVCALGLFLASQWVFLYYFFACLLYMLCIWFVMGFENTVHFLKNVGATFFCVLIFGGVFFLIYRFADVGSIMVFNNNVLYIDIPIFGLLCVSGICFGVIVLASKAFVFIVSSSTEYDVQVTILQNTKKAKAKVDTGNDLKDPISGNPVLLANERWIADILPQDMDALIQHGNIDPRLQSRFRMLYCKTATGSGLLPAIKPDFIGFTYNGKPILMRNVLIAISKTSLGDYDLLLSPHLFKEIDHDTSTYK